MALAVAGVLAWAGDDLEGVGGDGGGGKALGIVLSATVVAAGYTLLIRVPQGPLATAGVAASALGVPVFMGFLTYDPAEAAGGGDFLFGLPFSVNAVVIVSLAAWLATYLALPAGRGRVFYLALAMALLWPYIADQVEEGALVYLLILPFSFAVLPFLGFFEEEFPNPTAIGLVSLVFGAAYYVAAVLLDRWDRRGMATPFCAVGFAAMAIGIAHLADDLEAIGTGFVLIAVGAALATYGAMHGRRFTTWVWAAGIGVGVVAIIGDIFEDSATGGGVGLIVLGVGLVVAAHRLAQRLNEPDELEPGSSTFGRPAPPQPF